jgi:thiol-disulfide isomerase/thioredoxin
MTVPKSAAPGDARLRRRAVAAAAALGIMAFAAGSRAAQPTAVSGRAVGELTPSFPVLDVTGPHKGKSVCYVCESNGAPVVFAFFRHTGDETASLIRKLDELARVRGVRVVAVMIEGHDSQPWLERFAAENGITIPLTLLRNGKQDVAVKLYKLDPAASNTILVSAKRKVVANLVNANALDFATVVNAVARVAADPTGLPRIDARGIQSLVGRNKGKVVLLHFWATWCAPCLVEFPALVKLHAAYKARGLEVIAISLNDLAESQAVMRFVHTHNPAFPVFMTGTVGDKFYRAIDERWSSGLPLTMMYDRTGKLRRFRDGARTFTQFEQDVQALLD